MQEMTLVYQNRMALLRSTKGWCLLCRELKDSHADGTAVSGSAAAGHAENGTVRVNACNVWEPGNCLVFFPEGFTPDAVFGGKLEQLADKMEMRLLWIENPADAAECWSFTAGTGENPQIMVGEYWLALRDGVMESDAQISFGGIFGRNGDVFKISGERVVLSLSDCYGALSFSITVSKDGFGRLGSGIRFWYILPEDTPEGELCNFTRQVYASVISPHEDKDMDCGCSICPAAVGDYARTYIGLPAFTDWDSAFLSPQGGNILLKSADNVRLVFQKGAEVYFYDGGRQQYFAPFYKWFPGLEGEFLVSRDAVLMPGLSGTEYCANADRIKFSAGRSGLLEAGDGRGMGRIVTAKGEPAAQTSWISFRGTYCAAPVAMPFFDVGASYPRAYIPEIQKFTEWAAPFPAMPWSGIDAGELAEAWNGKQDPAMELAAGWQERQDSVWDVPAAGQGHPDGMRHMGKGQLAEDIQRLEQILAQERYRLLSAGTDNAAQSGGQAGKTEKLLVAPCGICIGLQPENGIWNWAGLAQTGEGGLPDIRLEHPSGWARKELQKPDCILMAQSKEEFLRLGEKELSFSLPADGWLLSFSAQDWDSHRLFVLKATETVTLRSCLADTPQLKRVLNMAYDKDGAVRKGYGPLLKVLDDKSFQGVFLLGGTAGIYSLSPQLQAALRLVRGGKAEAVYAAVSNGRITSGASGISIGRSAIDALVYYEGAPAQQSDGAPFTACTRELTAVIGQNAVIYFQSRLELSLYHIFGARLAPESRWDSGQIVLSGRMECTGAGTSYKFGVETQAAYTAADPPVASVQVRDAVLTVAGDVLSFELKGFLSFEKCEGLDLFSYGRIGFAGLQLICKDAAKYEVYYGSMRLSEDKAEIRPGSFAEAFGAKIDAVLFEREGESPDGLGYVSVNAPLKQGALSGKWNGLVWKVSLNSSGQLGRNEPLCLYLLGAWSGGGYYIGVRTDGIFGKAFSIQGILNAGFSGITMIQGKGGKLFFRLHSFALRALGLTFPKRGVDVFILGEHGDAAWCAAYEDGKSGPDQDGGEGYGI